MITMRDISALAMLVLTNSCRRKRGYWNVQKRKDGRMSRLPPSHLTIWKTFRDGGQNSGRPWPLLMQNLPPNHFYGASGPRLSTLSKKEWMMNKVSTIWLDRFVIGQLILVFCSNSMKNYSGNIRRNFVHGLMIFPILIINLMNRRPA